MNRPLYESIDIMKLKRAVPVRCKHGDRAWVESGTHIGVLVRLCFIGRDEVGMITGIIQRQAGALDLVQWILYPGEVLSEANGVQRTTMRTKKEIEGFLVKYGDLYRKADVETRVEARERAKLWRAEVRGMIESMLWMLGCEIEKSDHTGVRATSVDGFSIDYNNPIKHIERKDELSSF